MVMEEYHDDTPEEQLKKFKANYEMIEKVPIGEGTYGKVYKAKAVKGGAPVAMKQMKLESEEEGVPSTAIRETALLKELSHPNVVKLLDVFVSTQQLWLVFEFVETDLKKYMRSQQNNHINPASIKKLSYQLCLGIEFCHMSRIVHRDLKPQNLLIDISTMRLKIADFGLARAYSVPVPKYTHEVVTVWYRAPEILLGSAIYSIPVDIWSIGCVLAEMATGTPLFAGDSEIDTIFKIFQKLGTPKTADWPGIEALPDFKPSFPKWPKKPWQAIRNTAAQIGPDGINLLDKLMVYDPKQRWSARKAVNHAYFSDVDRAGLENPMSC